MQYLSTNVESTNISETIIFRLPKLFWETLTVSHLSEALLLARGIARNHCGYFNRAYIRHDLGLSSAVEHPWMSKNLECIIEVLQWLGLCKVYHDGEKYIFWCNKLATISWDNPAVNISQLYDEITMLQAGVQDRTATITIRDISLAMRDRLAQRTKKALSDHNEKAARLAFIDELAFWNINTVQLCDFLKNMGVIDIVHYSPYTDVGIVVCGCKKNTTLHDLIGWIVSKIKKYVTTIR